MKVRLPSLRSVGRAALRAGDVREDVFSSKARFAPHFDLEVFERPRALAAAEGEDAMIDRAGAGEGRIDRDRIGGVHDNRPDIAERMARGFELRPVAPGDGRPVAKAGEFSGGGQSDSRRSADDEDVFGHGVLKLQLL